jgi:hypothetical protein
VPEKPPKVCEADDGAFNLDQLAVEAFTVPSGRATNLEPGVHSLEPCNRVSWLPKTASIAAITSLVNCGTTSSAAKFS